MLIHPSQFAAKHAIYAGFKEFDRLYPKGTEASWASLDMLSTMALGWLLQALDMGEPYKNAAEDYAQESTRINGQTRTELSESYKQFCDEAKVLSGGSDEARLRLEERDAAIELHNKALRECSLKSHRWTLIQLALGGLTD